MDLLVRVSVVLRPINVSVASGSVRVLAVVKAEAIVPVMLVVLAVTSMFKRFVTSVLSTIKLVESERDLFVRVWLSEVPTIVPEGAVTVPRTPEVSVATPLPVARFISLPVVDENKATSLSTEVAVLVEASPEAGRAVQPTTAPEALTPKGY